MPAELLFLAARYIALFALAVSIALIVVRWRFPRAAEPSRKGPSLWREVRRAWRKNRTLQRERGNALRAIRGKSVLVVDPDEKSSKVLIWKLEGLGCKVTKARGGSQAVAMARSADIVISDALLPDVSAVDFCGSLRDVPILLVGVLKAQREEIDKLGTRVACLAKPFDPEDAAALAGMMLTQRRNLTLRASSV